jgi:seryl-tRNA synthetase
LTCQAYVRDPSPEPVQQQLPVRDVDMLSRELVASKESTMKALNELNGSLKKEKDDVIDEISDLCDKKLKLIDQKQLLVTEIESMKKEIRLLKAEREELKTRKVYFRKEGESNRNKLREMRIILHRS